jgi:hypothetical protein
VIYTNNEQTEIEIRETIAFIISSKLKWLGINLMKETKDLLNKNYKLLKKEITDFRIWKHLP